MPDKKITELTEITTPSSTDVLPIVTDVPTTPTTKKITFENLIASLFKITGGTITGDTLINANSGTAFKVERTGVRNNVIVVDTRSGTGSGGGDAGLGVGTTPAYLLHVYYAGTQVSGWNPVVFDASASTLTVQAVFGVRTSATTPTAGHHKAFMCWYGSDSYAFASFEFNAGGASKPGFSLGPGGVTSRDVGLVREGVNIGRICDGSTGYGSLLVSGLTIGSTTTVTANALTLNNANVILSTSTGTKIGTATNQKLGFFNATPVVQQTGCAVPTDLDSCIAAITALRTALNNLGLTTVV
jgi:hypothetical protein